MLSQQQRWISITVQTLMRAAALSSRIYSCQIKEIKLAQKQPVQAWFWHRSYTLKNITVTAGTLMGPYFSGQDITVQLLNKNLELSIPSSSTGFGE